MTRSQRRRSGDGLRSGRGHELLRGSGGHGRRLPLGLERAQCAPDLVPPPAEGDPERGAAVRGGPAAHGVGAVGGRVAGPERRHRHRARQRRWRARSSTPGSRTSGSSDTPPSTSRPTRIGGAVHARARGADHRRAGRRHPRSGARVRHGRQGDDLLDARHHRAPRRHRQRARPDQPVAAHGARGTLGLRVQPAARPEQRAGRRRHGRHPQQAPRLPGHARRRGPHAHRATVAHHHPAEVRMEPDGDVPGHGPRGADVAVRDRREPGAVRRRRPPRGARARRARPPGGAGDLPHANGAVGATSCCRPARAGARARAR